MKDIEQIIRENATAFGGGELPEGHLERFEARLDALGISNSRADESAPDSAAAAVGRHRSPRVLRLIAYLGAAAAAIAAVIYISQPAAKPTDWFAGIADDPVEICLAYSGKAAELSGAIYEKDLDGNLIQAVRSLDDGAIPMLDQLPDEMGANSKAEVLRRYYGALLDGLDEINKNI